LRKVAGSGGGDPRRFRRQHKVAEVAAVVPDVPGGSRRSLEVAAVVPDVPKGSERSQEVVAVVTDVNGGS